MWTRRASLGLLGFTLVVGCGLSLTPSGDAPVPGQDASLDGIAPPPPDASADTIPPPPPPKPFAFVSEEQAPEGTVLAMAVDEPSGKIAALLDEPGGGFLVQALGDPTPLFSFSSALQPTSFAPLARPAPPAFEAEVALVTNSDGLHVALNQSGLVPFGASPDAFRVVLRGASAFVGSSSPDGSTRIRACAFPAAVPDAGAPDAAPDAREAGAVDAAPPEAGPPTGCGQIVYDSTQMGGFTVSKDLLRLVGMTGAGATARLVESVRARSDGLFVTPSSASALPDALGEAAELVSVSDDGSTLLVRAKCRAAADRVCLATLKR